MVDIKRNAKKVAKGGANAVKAGAGAMGKAAGKVKDFAVDMKDQATEKKVDFDKLLKDAIDQYNEAYSEMNDSGISLYIQRQRSVDLIDNIETIINSIANKPYTFDDEINEIHINKEYFKNVQAFAQEKLNAQKDSVKSAGAGIAAGASVVSMAPTAAMWIATTFGTASTGTAISTLSGAAATNAAMAWLGGGAVAAGGGGVVGGQALLALAGPIGWGIAGASLLASIAIFKVKADKQEKEKYEEINSIKENTESLKEIIAEMNNINHKTVILREELNKLFAESLGLYGLNYSEAEDTQKIKLGTLINNTKALAALVSENIG